MSVVSFGELLIDFVSTKSDVTVGDAPGFLKAPGGAPANVAVAVAKLGHPSAFLTQVGDDPFGHYLAGVLSAENVDVSGIRFSSEARTALAFVSLTEKGERSFMFYRHPSADMLIRPDGIAFDLIDKAKIFHFGSITMIDEPAKSATLAAVNYARDRGLVVSYDPNLRLPLWPNVDCAKDGMLRGMDYANIVKISDEELIFLTGGDDVTPLWRESIQMIIVTYGENGATAYPRDGKPVKMAGHSVNPLDTTGAGDGFVAGILVSILENPDDYVGKLESILHFANAVGALTTAGKGAIPSLPTRAQVMAFLDIDR